MARFGPFFWYVCGHGHPRGPLTGGYGRCGLTYTSIGFGTSGVKVTNLVLIYRVDPLSTIMINITHLRMESLPLTNGHGRCIITVTPERQTGTCVRWGMAVTSAPSFLSRGHREHRRLRRRTEIIPVKDSHTRIKSLALANGQRPRPLHNR